MRSQNFEILEKILKDTNENKFHWYLNTDKGYFYSIRRINEKETTIDLIFKASDNYDEVENQLQMNYMCYIDIYMKKNKKNPVLLFRIQDNQNLIQDILEVVLKVYKEMPKKN